MSIVPTLGHDMAYTMTMDSKGKVRFKTPAGVPVPDQPDAVALAGRIEGAFLHRNRTRGVVPWGWAPVLASRKLPWELEERALGVLAG